MANVLTRLSHIDLPKNGSPSPAAANGVIGELEVQVRLWACWAAPRSVQEIPKDPIEELRRT